VEYARRLSDLFPQQVNESVFLASRLEADGQLEAAEEVYRDILHGDRENVVALNNLASLLAKKKRFVEAERYARHANRVVKDNPQLLDTLGWILYQKGQYSQAAEVLSKAAGLAPDIAVIVYHNGMAQMEIGNSAEAKAALQRALVLDSQADWSDSVRKKLAQ
jgi:Tfp pilus assembly protein PilF